MGKIKQMNLETQANNISEFLGVPLNKAKDRLALGFHANHHMVAEDWHENLKPNEIGRAHV